MPYPMIHMETAYRVLGKCNWIKEQGDFILGSVAPDAVHFHEHYDVHLKEISHLWDCGPKWGITMDSNRWRDAICGFWMQHKNDENRDFIAGYCTHLLTDWLNDRRMWAPFRMRIVRGEAYDEVYGQSEYREEAHGYDQWLHQASADSGAIWELLAKSRVYGLDGMILAKDLLRQKQSILTEQFIGEKEYDVSQYHYYTHEVISSFIEECVERIEEYINI